MTEPRLIAAKSGRPIASEVLGVTLAESDALFQVALLMAGTRVNPLDLLPGLAATRRGLAAEMDSPRL